MHPRVYLPVPKGEREVACPYCGTLYVLVDPKGPPPGEEREDRD